MPTIQAIHQLIIPGLKDKDAQRKILPGETAELADTDMVDDLIERGAARKVTKAEAKAIESGENPDDKKPAGEKETAAQKKAREKAEDEAAKNLQQNAQKDGENGDNAGDLV